MLHSHRPQSGASDAAAGTDLTSSSFDAGLSDDFQSESDPWPAWRSSYAGWGYYAGWGADAAQASASVTCPMPASNAEAPAASSEARTGDAAGASATPIKDGSGLGGAIL